MPASDPPVPESLAPESLAKALRHLQSGALEAARAELDPILAADPENAAALSLSGLCHLLSGDPGAATAALGRALALAPNDRTARGNLAVARRTMAQQALDADAPADARDGFLAALELVPEDARALLGLAQAEQELCRYGDALVAYEAYLGAAPADAEAHLGRAFCLQELRRPEDAMAAYRRVVALDPAQLGAVLKSLTTASSGTLWLKPSELRKALGLTS